MTEEEKKRKVQILADKLNNTLPLLDCFMNTLTDEDFELLKETRDALKERINVNNSAMVLITACGGNYDDTEDRMKLKTVDLLIDYIEMRKEYRDKMIEKQKELKNQQEVLKLFGILGI